MLKTVVIIQMFLVKQETAVTGASVISQLTEIVDGIVVVLVGGGIMDNPVSMSNTKILGLIYFSWCQIQT